MMYILNIAITLKKITIKELKDFFFQDYYKQIGIIKENIYNSTKRQKKDLVSFATKLILFEEENKKFVKR